MWNLMIKKDLGGICWSGGDVSLNGSSGVRLLGEDNCGDWSFVERRTGAVDELGCETAVIDDFARDGFLLTRTVCYNEADQSSFYIRLSLTNSGGETVRLDKFILLSAEGADAFTLGGQYKNWSLMRQGRHKNDIPSVCVLGEVDPRYNDALKGMVESGTGTTTFKGEAPEGIVSDELTVIRADRGKGPGSVTFGFLPCLDQLVNCEIKGDANRENFKSLELNCLLDGIVFDPGETVTSEWLRVDGNADPFKAIDDYVAQRGALTRLKGDLHPPMSIYFTWYFYGDSVREVDVMENLNYISEHNIPTDSFQIDSGWEVRYGDWEANHVFPHGMKYIADNIRERGMIPGLWTSPFIAETRSKLRYEHPEWLLKDEGGNQVFFRLSLENHMALDITHPDYLVWLEELYRKLTFDWGFTYHKLDFTRASVDKGSAYYNKKVTRAQAYKNAMEAVRRGAGPDAFVAICGGLFSPGAMEVDSHRTSSDVRSMWPAPEAGETESCPGQLKQNLLRFWMNELWHNDPDALMVRRRAEMYKSIKFTPGLLNDHEAETFAMNEYWGGGLVAYTEPMNEVDHDRLMLWRRFIPMNKKAAVPRDMFTTEGRYPSVMDSAVIPMADGLKPWHTLALVNWSGETKAVSFTLDESYLGDFATAGASYIVSELFSGKVWTGVKYGETLAVGDVLPHAAAQLRVAVEEQGTPELIGTDGNLSMGGTEISSWKFDGKSLAIGIDWRWDTPLTVKIRLPEKTRATCKDNRGAITCDGDIALVTFAGRITDSVVIDLD